MRSPYFPGSSILDKPFHGASLKSALFAVSSYPITFLKLAGPCSGERRREDKKLGERLKLQEQPRFSVAVAERNYTHCQARIYLT